MHASCQDPRVYVETEVVNKRLKHNNSFLFVRIFNGLLQWTDTRSSPT